MTTATAFDVFEDRLDAMGIKDQFETICLSFGVTLREVFGEDKHKSVSLARRKCCLYLRENMHKSNVEIGQIFNRLPDTIYRMFERESRHGKSYDELEPKTVADEKDILKERERCLMIARIHRRRSIAGLTGKEAELVTTALDEMILDIQNG